MSSVIASCFILQAANPFSDIAAFLCHSEERIECGRCLVKSNQLTVMKLGCSPVFFSQKRASSKVKEQEKSQQQRNNKRVQAKLHLAG